MHLIGCYGEFWLEGAGLSPLVKKQNHKLPSNVDSEGIYKHGVVEKAESSVWHSSQNVEDVRSSCQQMATRLLLFIKSGPSVDHGISMSADKFQGSYQMNPFSEYTRLYNYFSAIYFGVTPQGITNSSKTRTEPGSIKTRRCTLPHSPRSNDLSLGLLCIYWPGIMQMLPL